MGCFWLAWEHTAFSAWMLCTWLCTVQLPTDVGQERLNLQTEQEQNLAPVLRGESQTVLFTW